MSNLKCKRETILPSERKRLEKIGEALYESGWFVLDTQWMKNPRLAVFIAPIFKRGESETRLGFVSVTLDGAFPTIFMPTENSVLVSVD